MASSLRKYESSSDEEDGEEHQAGDKQNAKASSATPEKTSDSVALPSKLGGKRPRVDSKAQNIKDDMSKKPRIQSSVAKAVDNSDMSTSRAPTLTSSTAMAGRRGIPPHSVPPQLPTASSAGFTRAIWSSAGPAASHFAASRVPAGAAIGPAGPSFQYVAQPPGQIGNAFMTKRMGKDAEAARAAADALGISPAMAAAMDPVALRDMMKASGGGRRKGRLRAALTAQHGGGTAAVAAMGSQVRVSSVSARQVHGQWAADDIAAIGSAPAPQRSITSSAWDAEAGQMTTIEGGGAGVGQRKKQNQLTVMASRAMQLEAERLGPSAEETARAAKKASRKKYGF